MAKLECPLKHCLDNDKVLFTVLFAVSFPVLFTVSFPVLFVDSFPPLLFSLLSASIIVPSSLTQPDKIDTVSIKITKKVGLILPFTNNSFMPSAKSNLL